MMASSHAPAHTPSTMSGHQPTSAAPPSSSAAAHLFPAARIGAPASTAPPYASAAAPTSALRGGDAEEARDDVTAQRNAGRGAMGNDADGDVHMRLHTHHQHIGQGAEGSSQIRAPTPSQSATTSSTMPPASSPSSSFVRSVYAPPGSGIIPGHTPHSYAEHRAALALGHGHPYPGSHLYAGPSGSSGASTAGGPSRVSPPDASPRSSVQSISGHHSHSYTPSQVQSHHPHSHTASHTQQQGNYHSAHPSHSQDQQSNKRPLVSTSEASARAATSMSSPFARSTGGMGNRPQVTASDDSLAAQAGAPAPAAPAPTVYLATYSSIPVYELTVRGIAVMRRRSDGFLNATQILKLAGVEKGRRTKILEKEILIGEHEKVQGGYGKYQGTWIPLKRAQELAATYSVAHLLRPLLEFDPSTASSVPQAAQRKRANNSNASNIAAAAAATAAAALQSSVHQSAASVDPGDRYLRAAGATKGALPTGPRAAGSQPPLSFGPGMGGRPTQQPRFLSLRPPPEASDGQGSARLGSPAPFMPPGAGGLPHAMDSTAPATATGIPAGSSQAQRDVLQGYSNFGYTPQGVPLPVPSSSTTALSKQDVLGSKRMEPDSAENVASGAKRPRQDIDGVARETRAEDGITLNGVLSPSNAHLPAGTPETPPIEDAAPLGPSPVKDLNALGPAGGAHRAATRPRNTHATVGPPDLAREGNVFGGGGRIADRARPPKVTDEGERRMRDCLTNLFVEEDDVPSQTPGRNSEQTSEPAAPTSVQRNRATEEAEASQQQDGNPDAARLDRLLLELRDTASLGGMGASGSGPSPCVDLVIDDHGHTALHWASALCRLPLVRALVARSTSAGGANVHAGNYAGETALQRAVLVTNSYDASAFPALLLLLAPSLHTRDHKRRTVLHHIALVAALRGRAAPARYYLACVLDYIAAHDSGRPSALVDAQDEEGETALGIAARVGNASMVRMLLDVGARKDLPNVLGIRPADWGVGSDTPDALSCAPAPLSGSAASELAAQRPQDIVSALGRAPQVPVQKSKDVLEQMSSMLNDLSASFERELTEKQTALQTAQAHLQAATRELASRRRLVTNAQARVAERDEARQRVGNLRRALGEHVIGDVEGKPDGPSHHLDHAVDSPDAMDVDRTSADGNSIKAFKTEAFADLAALESPLAELEKARSHSKDLPADIEELVRLRWLAAWYKKACGGLEARIVGLEGASARKELQCKKVVAMCCNVPSERVENMLDELVVAIESDGAEVDLARVAGFMTKVARAEKAPASVGSATAPGPGADGPAGGSANGAAYAD